MSAACFGLKFCACDSNLHIRPYHKDQYSIVGPERGVLDANADDPASGRRVTIGGLW